MKLNFNWLAQYALYRDSVELLGLLEVGNERQVLLPITEVKRLDRHVAVESPTLELSKESAQSLMQALWQAGIRPTEWNNPNGEINALRKHIEFAEHVSKAMLEHVGKSA